MAHPELSLCGREMIEDMLNAKFPVSQISSRIFRPLAIASRAIKGNGNVGSYVTKLKDADGMIARRDGGASWCCSRFN